MSSNSYPHGGSTSNQNPVFNKENAKLMPVSKWIFVSLAIINIISMFYPPLYYFLSNTPYFITYSQYEVYRIFTSIFVDSFSLNFILSMIISPFVASYIERRDGSVLLVYRIIMITLISNILFTLVSWPILNYKPVMGFLLSMSGYSNIWFVFLFIEMVKNPEVRRAVTSSCFAKVMAVILIISFLLSVSSIVILVTATLLYYISSLYSPRKSVAAFFIPFPVYRKLQSMDEEERRTEMMNSPTVSRKPLRRGQPMTIDSLSNDQPQQDFSTTSQGSQMFAFKKPEADGKSSRFQGTSHTLGGNL